MKQGIETKNAPAPIGPYSQGVSHGNMIFVSGQIGVDPVTGTLVGNGDTALEAGQAIRNLVAILTAAGATPSDVVKTSIFLTDLADFAKVNEVYGRTFGAAPAPARATVQVSALPRGAKVEMDVIAMIVKGR